MLGQTRTFIMRHSTGIRVHKSPSLDIDSSWSIKKSLVSQVDALYASAAMVLLGRMS